MISLGLGGSRLVRSLRQGAPQYLPHFKSCVFCLALLAISDSSLADCQVVGEYDDGEPVIECDDEVRRDGLLHAEICDPRVVGDCYDRRNPNPRPYADKRSRLPYRGGVPGPAAGSAPRNAAGPAPFGAAGGPPRSSTGR